MSVNAVQARTGKTIVLGQGDSQSLASRSARRRLHRDISKLMNRCCPCRTAAASLACHANPSCEPSGSPANESSFVTRLRKHSKCIDVCDTVWRQHLWEMRGNTQIGHENCDVASTQHAQLSSLLHQSLFPFREGCLTPPEPPRSVNKLQTKGVTARRASPFVIDLRDLDFLFCTFSIFVFHFLPSIFSSATMLVCQDTAHPMYQE